MTTHNIAAAPPVSLEEYAALPAEPRHELVRGVLIELMNATFGHERTVGIIIYRLLLFVVPNQLGEVYGSNATYVTEPGPRATARKPDVSFVTVGRRPQPDTVQFQGSPDLAIEVLSPNNTRSEIAQKVSEYLNAGGKAVWVIDIDARTLTVHTADAPPVTLTDADIVNGGDYLPGFACAVADLLPAG